MSKRPPQRRPKTGDAQLFSLRLPTQVWREVSVFAKLKERSMNALLCEVIEKWWAAEDSRASVSRLVKASGSEVETKRRKDGTGK